MVATFGNQDQILNDRIDYFCRYLIFGNSKAHYGEHHFKEFLEVPDFFLDFDLSLHELKLFGPFLHQKIPVHFQLLQILVEEHTRVDLCLGFKSLSIVFQGTLASAPESLLFLLLVNSILKACNNGLG